MDVDAENVIIKDDAVEEVIESFESAVFDSDEQSSPAINLDVSEPIGLCELDIGCFPESDIISTEVQKPETRGDGNSSFIVYTVKTLRVDPGENTSVERRFKDFIWLRESLRRSNKGIIIPPLPQKNMSMELSLNNWGFKSTTSRSSVDFINQRQRGLAVFLKQVVTHDQLKTDPATQTFLSAHKADIHLARANPTTKQNNEDSIWGMFHRTTGSISESLGFGKVKSVTLEDTKVKNIGEINQKSTLCTGQLLEALTSVKKRQLQISQSWFNMGVASQGFSQLITENPQLNHDSNGELASSLGGLARSVEHISNLTAKVVQEVSEHCSEPLRELKRTGPAIDDILKDRDATLCEVVDCKTKLEQEGENQLERSNLKYMLKLKAEKTEIELKEITARVVNEYSRFEEKRVDSLKQILRDYVRREVQFHEQSLLEFKKLQADLIGDKII